jgi:hypothetical protein
MLYTFLVNKSLWSAPLYQAEKQAVGLKQRLSFSTAKIHKKIHLRPFEPIFIPLAVVKWLGRCL